MELPNVLTVSGALVVIIILVTVVKQAIPNFDSARFGALLSIGLGIGLVALANVTAVGELRLDGAEMILTGVLAGASASGLYDVSKVARGGSSPGG